MKYRVISADDHLQEAPDTWASRMSRKKWGSKIPEIRSNGDGTESWYVWDQPKRFVGVAAVHGALPDRATEVVRWDQVPEITYVPSERIKAMDQDGVDAHTFFGNIAGVAGNTFSAPSYPDNDFRLECIRAFNDFQIDEYSDPYPGRFITLAVVPLWDVDAAVAEVHRMKKRGIHGLSFAFPHQFQYPHVADPYWDPFWEAAQEADLPVNFHIGSGGSMGVWQPPFKGHDAMTRLAENSTSGISANTQVMTVMLFSGALQKFPRLQIVSAESGLGWVPYLLETADHQWGQQKLQRVGMEMKPSDYFRRQCYVTFWFEVMGLKLRDYIGVDRIMWESDYPHPTCTWPDSQDYIERGLAEVTEDERQQILVDNAVKLYHLERYQD